MPQCPIYKSEAEDIDLGLFDGAGFSCKRHGRVQGRRLGVHGNETAHPPAMENALAERRAAFGTRPLITTYDF